MLRGTHQFRGIDLLDNIKMFFRFVQGLREFTSHRITLDAAREIIERRMSEREQNFLRLVRRGIFGNPKSIYLALMKLAGCDYGDIEESVRRRGVEATLHMLREAGVYVSFEEFKGRTPLVRNGRRFKVSTSDFANPHLKKHYMAESGGTTGVGRRIPLELDHLGEQAPQLMLARAAHNCLDAPTAMWRGPIPDGTGLNNLLRALRHDRMPQKWFTAHLTGDSKPRLGYRMATQSLLISLRLLSVPVPRPEPIRLDQADIPARWAGKMLERHGACCIMTPVGRALRICIAAQELGIDLRGTVFQVGGEPVTPAKVRAIEETGARCYPIYAMFEMGQLALGCANPQCSDDMHWAIDCHALITHPHPVAGGAAMVDALNCTSLLPTAPLIMLNVEIDDYGVVEDRNCGCPLHELGYTRHVSRIASYSKVVSEGVTLIGSDVVRILEEVLPTRFGGGPIDYQLVEEEDQKGLTRVSLLVSNRVKLDDEEELKQVFMRSLTKGPESYKWARSIWNQGQTLQVCRREPFATSRGKHLSLWRNKNGPDLGAAGL